MTQLNRPSKEQIRQWTSTRQAERKPLPDLEQIRRELGWNFTERIRTGK
jgi:hypothetical protein